MPPFSPIIFVLVFSNSDHFCEVVTLKFGGPDETAIQLLCFGFYQPLFVSVLMKQSRRKMRMWKRMQADSCECVRRKKKQTHRGDLKYLKCLAGTLSDIWWINHHRPMLSYTNSSLAIPFETCFDLFIKIQKFNEKG